MAGVGQALACPRDVRGQRLGFVSQDGSINSLYGHRIFAAAAGFAVGCQLGP